MTTTISSRSSTPAPTPAPATIRASGTRRRCDYCDLGACQCARSLALSPVGVVVVTHPGAETACQISTDDVSAILWVDRARWVAGALSPHVVAPLADVAGLL